MNWALQNCMQSMGMSPPHLSCPPPPSTPKPFINIYISWCTLEPSARNLYIIGRIRTTPQEDNSPPYRFWSWWGVLFCGSGPSGELSWWGIVLGIVVLVGNGWALFLSGGELSSWGVVLEPSLAQADFTDKFHLCFISTIWQWQILGKIFLDYADLMAFNSVKNDKNLRWRWFFFCVWTLWHVIIY